MIPRTRLGVFLSVPQYSLLMQFINSQRTEGVDSMKSVSLLRYFDTVFRRTYRCFFNRLKSDVILDLIGTKFSPVIDYELKFVKMQFLETMTTIKKNL